MVHVGHFHSKLMIYRWTGHLKASRRKNWNCPSEIETFSNILVFEREHLGFLTVGLDKVNLGLKSHFWITNLKLIWTLDNLKWLLLGKLLRFCLALVRIWISSPFNWLLGFDILGGLNYFALCSRAVHPAVMKTVDSVLPKIQFLIRIEMKNPKTQTQPRVL